jgi:hypothetical protein
MAGGRHELGEIIIGHWTRVDVETADHDPVRRSLFRIVLTRTHPELAAGHPDKTRPSRRACHLVHTASIHRL